jgi:hypothetical protein
MVPLAEKKILSNYPSFPGAEGGSCLATRLFARGTPQKHEERIEAKSSHTWKK